MNKKILAILDREERFAKGLTEYLMSKENLPFRIHMFTDINRFYEYNANQEIECLLIAQNMYSEEIKKTNIPHIIVLGENGVILDSTLHHINKYQSVEMIYKQILSYYSEASNESMSILRTSERRLKVIAIYTPIGRCLQTTFAITLGQILAKEYKTLYLNFERYSGLANLLKKEFSSDIADLMYYFECAKEKLSVRIETLVDKMGDLEFIPPVNLFGNLCGIKGSEWIDLFREMEKCTEYEYLILDLSDGIPELCEVLKDADVVYTLTKQDRIALSKMRQYENILQGYEYEDILNKTKKISLPVFKSLPNRFEEYCMSELSSFIRLNIVPQLTRLSQKYE